MLPRWLSPHAKVFGIWGSLVVLWRLCMVLGPSSLTEVLTLAELAIVFILLELRELEELGVWRVPEGLSATSWKSFKFRYSSGFQSPLIYLWWSWQPSSKPSVSKSSVRSHPGCRVPLQTSPDKVKEQRVVTTLESCLQFPWSRGPARFASPASASVEDCGAVRKGRGCAVPRIT